MGTEGKERGRFTSSRISSINIGEISLDIGYNFQHTLVSTDFFEIQEKLEREAKDRLGKKILPIDVAIRCARQAAQESGAQNILSFVEDFALELNSNEVIQKLKS